VGGGVEAIVVQRFRTCALGGSGARDGRGDGEVKRCAEVADGRVRCGCWSLLCPWSATWDGNATGANRRSRFFCQCGRKERPNVPSVVAFEYLSLSKRSDAVVEVGCWVVIDISLVVVCWCVA
jgi:hypothetical protein